MANYRTILTNIGLAKIAAAIADADEVTPPSVAVSSMVFGDGNGNPTTPVETQDALVREVYQATLNRLELNLETNRYIAEAVIPADEGGWTVREVGLLDTDGDLFAVASFPDVYKPTAGEGAVRDLVVRLVFEVTNAAEVELIVDPSVVLATRSWVEGNFDLATLIPGGTTLQILRKKSNADGDTEWADPAEIGNVTVDIVEEVQTLSASQTIVNLAVCTADAIGVYINGVRKLPTAYSKTGDAQITLVTPASGGESIHIVQNDPTGEVDFLQSPNNLSDVESTQEARENLGFPSATDSNFMGELFKALMAFQYPVGEILITRRTGNPSTWLGFGTWERYASGRTLVSLDPVDASFQTLDQTGGAKTHVLTIGELPAHQHVIDPPATTTTTAGEHKHTLNMSAMVHGPLNQVMGNAWTDTTAVDHAVNPAGAHAHVIDIPPFNSGGVGSGQAHNNLQPYIVVHMWRRTA